MEKDIEEGEVIGDHCAGHRNGTNGGEGHFDRLHYPAVETGEPCGALGTSFGAVEQHPDDFVSEVEADERETEELAEKRQTKNPLANQ